MKTEDYRLLTAFCTGKVITQIEFLGPDKIRIGFDSGSGIEISEPKADAKGLVVRILHGPGKGSASA
ncbi:MAG TPA: hypothetical protein VES89_04225 [Candidatus Competibacteraceae bacterium]|nr:hypothetical protein [Candidatus Competibacteraceae bacterium]